ncbi:MAG: TonB-dependent receptor [Bacteroidota bacterium]
MRAFVILLLGVLSMESHAQFSITGKVQDRKGKPLMYANIYLEGSYEGTTSDSTGAFVLHTGLTGQQVLVASYIAYEKFTLEINPEHAHKELILILSEVANEINEVAITAGVFSASDRKKAATLTSFDIASTASALGDIYGAYATMPGSQKVGEEGMLFVRGGDASETKTYMDGMLVQTPYFSNMPQIPTRGRFSPLLFSETLFSTGGYSAEYGQALSSIVDLTTNGLESEDKASVSLMTVGANASLARRWENSSLAMTGFYANNALQHKIFKQNVDWIKDPVLWDGMLMYRHKVGETGLLKTFLSYNYNAMQMNYDNFEAGSMDRVRMKNNTIYTNTTYSGALSEKLQLRTGAAYSIDREAMVYRDLPVRTNNSAGSVKLALSHLSTHKIKIRTGVDLIHENYSQRLDIDTTASLELKDTQTALFLESELKLSSKIALRIGTRAEFSSLMNSWGVLPRLSAAYKTGRYSQVSLAWGKYRQKPVNDYLKFAPTLTSEKSGHYILNFQYRKNRRIFRVESYLKQYKDLVKYEELYSFDPFTYTNHGHGYAGGVDLFWRDSESLRGADYWVSYSYLNTSRDYKDYPSSVAPHYASSHNLSLVYKHFIEGIRTFAGFTYSFASARPYDDKNSTEFMDGRTKAYNDLSLNLTYLTRMFQKECIIHLTIINLPGFKNIFGYNFSATPGEDGLYASRAIVPTSKRQAVLLIILSL